MTVELNDYTVMMVVDDSWMGKITAVGLRKDKTPALVASHYSDEYFENIAKQIVSEDLQSLSPEELDYYCNDVLMETEMLIAEEDWTIWVFDGEVDVRNPDFSPSMNELSVYIGQMKDGKYTTLKDRNGL